MKTQGFRTFFILWGTQTVSILGSSLTTFAINLWLVQRLYPLPEQKQQLALALTALGAVEALCIVATSPLAGWWVDRHDRKRTMLLADFASCGSTLALAYLLFSGRLTMCSLLPVAALGFAMRSFHTLAFRSSYVMLVPEEQLPRANGMMESSYWLSGILAPSLTVAVIALPSLARGGWLAILDDGMPLVLLLDGATFLLAAFTLPFLRISSPAPPPQPVQRGHPALEGLRLLRRYPSLLWMVLIFTFSNFGPPMEIYFVLITKTQLAPDWARLGFSYETALALLFTLNSLGGGLGGLLMILTGGLKKERIYGMLLALVLHGFVILVLGLSSWYVLSVAAALLVAATVPVMNAHENAILQSRIPPGLQGRFFAVDRVIGQVTWPLGTALWGWAAGMGNPAAILAGWGCLSMLFFISQFFNPRVLSVETIQISESK